MRGRREQRGHERGQGERRERRERGPLSNTNLQIHGSLGQTFFGLFGGNFFVLVSHSPVGCSLASVIEGSKNGIA
jgi:hypothetical protein